MFEFDPDHEKQLRLHLFELALSNGVPASELERVVEEGCRIILGSDEKPVVIGAGGGDAGGCFSFEVKAEVKASSPRQLVGYLEPVDDLAESNAPEKPLLGEIKTLEAECYRQDIGKAQVLNVEVKRESIIDHLRRAGYQVPDDAKVYLCLGGQALMRDPIDDREPGFRVEIVPEGYEL